MKIMAIGAHFDDIELGCGGTLVKHIEEGNEVTMLVVTNAEYFNYNGDLRRTKEVALREGKTAAGIIGAKLICGDLKTKTLAYSWRLIEFLNEQIDALRIELVYTHWDQDVHQDHSAVGRATVSAGRHISRILMYQSNWYATTVNFRGTFYVDISGHTEKKIAALRSHETEYHLRGEEWIQFFRNVNSNCGQEIGVKYAECFEVVKYLN